MGRLYNQSYNIFVSNIFFVCLLFEQHTDENLYHYRKRLDKYRDIFSQDVAILSDLFAQQLIENFLQHKKEGLKNFELDANVLEFVKGKKLQRGRPWKKCKALYMPLNVKGSHWVALFINIVKCQITVFDSDVATTMKEEMGEHVRPLCAMLPLVLRMTKKFKHPDQHLTKAWTWRHSRNMCTQTHRR